MLSDTKILRFKHIAREALEQCGGVIMPEIEFLSVAPLGKTKNTENLLDIVLDTQGEIQNIAKMPHSKEIHLWVGPEGGWSENERSKMI